MSVSYQGNLKGKAYFNARKRFVQSIALTQQWRCALYIKYCILYCCYTP